VNCLQSCTPHHRGVCRYFLLASMMRVAGTVANGMQGEWEIPMLSCQAPCTCCVSCFCACAMAHQQRRIMLDITGEDYVCCAGACLCCDEPWSRREPFMWLEACCCLHAATLGNRYMMQTRFDIRNDSCDNFLLRLTSCCDVFAGCLEACISSHTANQIRHLGDCANVTVCCCMLAQQQVQLQAIRRAQPYNGPPENVREMLPPKQQEMVNVAKERREAYQPARSQTQHLALPLDPRETHMQILVPADCGPGQELQIETPYGPRHLVVPDGVTPGEQFSANI